MTPDYILNEISHANLLLYAAAIPSYDADKNPKKDGKEDLEWGGSLDYSNPDNFKSKDTIRERV